MPDTFEHARKTTFRGCAVRPFGEGGLGYLFLPIVRLSRVARFTQSAEHALK